MKASALMFRRIGSFERRLGAAPTYLEQVGPLDDIADLSRCDFVALERLPDGITLLRNNDSVDVVPERSRVTVDSVAAARSAVLAGLGVQGLPATEIGADLAAVRQLMLDPSDL